MDPSVIGFNSNTNVYTYEYVSLINLVYKLKRYVYCNNNKFIVRKKIAIKILIQFNKK